MKLFWNEKSFNKAIVKALTTLPQIAPGRFLFPFNGSIGGAIHPSWSDAGHIKQFVSSADIFSIVDRIASTIAAVPLITYRKTKDKKALRLYECSKSLNILHRIKALEPLNESDPLNEILESPNKNLTQRDFVYLICVLYLCGGEAFIYKMKTGAERGGKAVSMHLFTGADTAIYATSDFPYEAYQYKFSYNRQVVLDNVPADDVIVIKKPNPSFDKRGAHLRGLSPLTPGKDLTESLDIGQKRRTNTLRNGSLPGIIFNEGEPGTEQDAPNFEKWKKMFQDFNESVENSNVPFPMNGKVGYIQTGLKALDMQLMENVGLDFKKACNLYHISTILFNSDVAATESNVQEMVKLMYTNACMPVSDAIKDAFNKDKDLSEKGIKYMDFDYTSIPALQQDMQKMMNAVAAAPAGFTGNEIRALWGYERAEVEEMDKFLLKQGYGFIDDRIELPDPLEGLDNDA